LKSARFLQRGTQFVISESSGG